MDTRICSRRAMREEKPHELTFCEQPQELPGLFFWGGRHAGDERGGESAERSL